MASLTVRISERAHRILQSLADETKQPMTEILAQAIEEFQQNRFWEQTNAAFAALRNDPQAWAQEQEERRAWEATLADGLSEREAWDE